MAQSFWFTAAPAAGSSKGKSRAAGGGGASWDSCVWAGRKGQEGFGQCEGHRLVWEPPLHQGHCTGSQGGASVHREAAVGWCEGLAVLGRALGTPSVCFFRGWLGLDTGLMHSWAGPRWELVFPCLAVAQLGVQGGGRASPAQGSTRPGFCSRGISQGSSDIPWVRGSAVPLS